MIFLGWALKTAALDKVSFYTIDKKAFAPKQSTFLIRPVGERIGHIVDMV